MKSTDLRLSEFVSLLSSAAPAPGGGGAAALTGAIGMALGTMVASLTLGKPKYAEVEGEILELKTQAEALQARLIALVAEDAEVFEPLAKAYGLPKGTPEEAAHKAQVMEACLLLCAKTPLKIMECSAAALLLVERVAQVGSTLALSDAGCAALTLKAALSSADLNVRVNTKLMQDRDAAAELNAAAEVLLQTYIPKADDVYACVRARYNDERGMA